MTGEPLANPLFPYGQLDPAALIATLSTNPALVDAQSRTKAIDQALRDKLAGTDPDYVQTPDDFSGYSHQAIYDGVHGTGGMNVTTINTLRDTWNNLDTELTRIATTHQTSANALLSIGEWAGASGDAARTGITALNNSIQQVAQVCAAMKSRLDIVGSVAEALRTAVPPPTAQLNVLNPDDTHTSLIPGLINPATATVDRQAQRQAELDAQATMNRIYTPNYPPTGSGVPSYSVVPAGPGTDTPNGTGGGSPTAGSPVADPASPTTDSPAADTPTEPETPTSEDPTTPTSDTDDTTSPSATTDTDETGSPDTTPASASPTATTPAGLGSAPSGAGSPVGSGGSGGGSPLGGTGSPGAGSSVPGVGQSPAAGGAVASGGAAAGSRMGSAPMGMMPGAGAGRKSEEDGEHRAPDYLRGVHPDWLAGTAALSGPIGDDYNVSTDFSSAAPGAAQSRPRTEPSPDQTDASRIGSPPTAAPAATATPPPIEPAPPADMPVAQQTIEPTAPTLPPEVAALLADHGAPTDPLPSDESGPTQR